MWLFIDLFIGFLYFYKSFLRENKQIDNNNNNPDHISTYVQKQPPKCVLQKRCSDLPRRTIITASCQLSIRTGRFSQEVKFTYEHLRISQERAVLILPGRREISVRTPHGFPGSHMFLRTTVFFPGSQTFRDFLRTAQKLPGRWNDLQNRSVFSRKVE